MDQIKRELVMSDESIEQVYLRECRLSRQIKKLAPVCDVLEKEISFQTEKSQPGAATGLFQTNAIHTMALYDFYMDDLAEIWEMADDDYVKNLVGCIRNAMDTVINRHDFLFDTRLLEILYTDCMNLLRALAKEDYELQIQLFKETKGTTILDIGNQHEK